MGVYRVSPHERPPAVDLEKYRGEEKTIGYNFVTGEHGKLFLEDKDAILADLVATRRERDEAMEEHSELRTQYDILWDEAEKIRQERDAARKELEEANYMKDHLRRQLTEIKIHGYHPLTKWPYDD